MASVVVRPRHFPGSPTVRSMLGVALKASIAGERAFQRVTLRVHAWHTALDPDLPDAVARAFKEADNLRAPSP